MHDVNKRLTIGDFYTWTPDYVDAGTESGKTFLNFVSDIEIHQLIAHPHLSGLVVYNDGNTAIIAVSDMTSDMFPFTLYLNEVEIYTSYKAADKVDPYQRYFCLHVDSLISLFYFDIETSVLAEAEFDENSQFIGYDFEIDYFDVPPSKIDLGSPIEKLEVLLPAEEIERLEDEGIIEEPRDVYPDYIAEKERLKEMPVVSAPCSLFRARNWMASCDCAIITAWRKEKSRQQRDEDNRNLQRALRDFGYGVSKVRGHYTGTDNETSTENSFLVFDRNNEPDAFLANIYRLSEKYEQECFVYKEAGLDKPAIIIGTNDCYGKGKRCLLGRLRIGNMSARDYSEIGSGRITFE